MEVQEDRTPFYSANENIKAAPVICYESVYGEYVSEYVKNGANFIFIITNDGWWGDTPGYNSISIMQDSVQLKQDDVLLVQQIQVFPDLLISAETYSNILNGGEEPIALNKASKLIQRLHTM